MTTSNVFVGAAWTKIAESSDEALLVTWTDTTFIEFATTIVDAAPTVIGHQVSREEAVTRNVFPNGYVWARTLPGSYPATCRVVVTK